MKAIILTAYGPPEVLQLQEIEKPVPKNNEVLIRIHATSVNYGDLLARNFKEVTPRQFNMPMLFWFFAKIFFGFNKPKIKILGNEFAGDVESVGSSVTVFKPGDKVSGYLAQFMGAYAEYICVPENGVLAKKPESVSYEEAAVSMGGIMALPLLRKMNIQKGEKVLINGASGAIGAAAVQIAKQFGAEVTGVCGTARLEYVKSLGAHKAIDYTKEDFTRNGETYDLIVDILGRCPFSRCKKSLTENGRILYVSFKTKQLMQMVWTAMTGGKKVLCRMAPGSKEDLLSVRQLLESGRFKPIIDRRFPLEQAAEAHRYAESGEKKGSIVITVE